jgi:hypothetical protein
MEFFEPLTMQTFSRVLLKRTSDPRVNTGLSSLALRTGLLYVCKTLEYRLSSTVTDVFLWHSADPNDVCGSSSFC